MKKHLPLIIGATIVLLAVSAYLLFFQRGQEISLTSADGVLSLQISDKALPNGISMDEITIDPVETGEEGVVAFELGPDGTQLKDDAEVTFTVPLEADAAETIDVPVLVHLSGPEGEGARELVDGTHVNIDYENGELSITGPISHFSRIEMWRVDGLFEVQSTTPSTEHKIDETFKVSFAVRPKHTTNKYHDKWGKEYGYDEYRVKPGSKWGIRGKVVSNYTDRIAPWEREVPARTGIGYDDSYSAEVEFTCKEGGSEPIGAASGEDALYVTYTVSRQSFYPVSHKDDFESRNLGDVQHATSISFRERHTCKEDEFIEWEYQGSWDHDYPALSEMTEKQIWKLGKTIKVPSLALVIEGQTLTFPFPDTQFHLEEAHSGIEETGGDAYCATEHYHRQSGLSIEERDKMTPEPADPYGAHCGFNSYSSGGGSLEVDPGTLIEWMQNYRQFRR